MVSSFNVSEHVTTVNQILANARLLRERLAADSTEASKKLSAAVLDAIMYAEQVENTNRLVALADSCVGQIRSRMRACGIPIQPSSTPLHPPSMLFDAITTPDVNGLAVQGMPPFFTHTALSLRIIRWPRGISVRYYIRRQGNHTSLVIIFVYNPCLFTCQS